MISYFTENSWTIENLGKYFLCFIILILAILICCILIKKKPYQAAQNHYYAVVWAAAIIICIYILLDPFHFLNPDSWLSLADNIVSGVFFIVFCALFIWIEKRQKNKHEDNTKLRQDYKNLSKLYDKDNLIRINSDAEETIYPIVDLGSGCVRLNEQIDNHINIQDNMNSFYTLPTMVENKFEELFSSHDTSNIYNNLNVRVIDMKIKNDVLFLTTERTTYFQSLVTNRASDFEFMNGVSIREMYEMGPLLTPLNYSKLSNHLGYNGFVESSDGFIVFVLRSGFVSIGKNTYGDSIGASLKTKYCLDDKGHFTTDGLRNAIYNEINDELKIPYEDICHDESLILGAYRDCVECGKPQLVTYAKSSLSSKEININFNNKIRNRNFELIKNLKSDMSIKKELQEKKALEDGRKLVWLHKSELPLIRFSYEGVSIEKQNYSNGFISYGLNGNIVSNIFSLTMTPSATVCIYYLKEFLYGKN